MSVLAYVKFALIAAACLWMYHLGAEAGTTRVAEMQSSQAMNTAKAVLAERASDENELNRVNALVANYETTPINPIALTVGSRVFKYASAASCAVPKTTAAAGGTSGSAGVSVGPSEVEQRLSEYIQACSRDAERLSAVIAAWPQ